MRNLLFIDVTDRAFLNSNRANAISKPRRDTQATLERCGYHAWIVGNHWFKLGRPTTIVEKVQRKLHLLQIYFAKRSLNAYLQRHPACQVVVQYPFLVPEMLDFLEIVKRHGGTVTALLHDFYMIREHRTYDKVEQWLLDHADTLIVHSQPMEEALRGFGFKGECRQLGFFDYQQPAATAETKPVVAEGSIDLLFAGNLSKAPFIAKLGTLPQQADLCFRLYGLPALAEKPDTEVMPGCRYMGCFDNENPSGIVGNWGLVWDGDSMESCTGDMGEYLRYNAPFKFSLYLSIGIPVVVWRESAMAKYVEQLHLGICVDSLSDIHDTIRALSPEQCRAIAEGVAAYSQRVRSGKMLEQVL